MKNIAMIFILGSMLALSACVANAPVYDTRSESFAYADRNHDGALSYGEYKTFLARQADRGDKDAKHAIAEPQNPEKTKLLRFQSLDSNRDSYLIPSELGF